MKLAREDAADGVVGYDESFDLDDDSDKLKNLGKLYDLELLDESK